MAHTVVQILSRGDIAELTRVDRTDGQLLDLFVHKRDEEAFATVVRRHGPMVLSVCRRILRNPADADDAFQAAFLVLARKAASLGSHELLAPWLYGVASNTARKLRHSNARRAQREKQLAEVPEQFANLDWDSHRELIAILDEELSRLPERYRQPIVLCDLEGNTRREAARLLGCPEGTVAGRLARARAMLADRLMRRGIAPAGGLLAAVLTERSVCAAAQIPELLRAMQGQISSRVSDVTERVLTAMFARKIQGIVVAVLFCGLLFAGIAGTFHLTANADPGFAPSDAKGAKPATDAKPSEKKVFTAFPLKKADAALTASLVTEHFKNKPGITISSYDADNTLLVYADEKTTTEVEALLKKLGEEPRRKPAVLQLDKGTKAADAASAVTELFGGKSRIWIEPAQGENALLVYATEIDTLTIRKLLGITATPGGNEPTKPAAEAKPEPKKYTFGFRNTPWADVLAWYAEESGLTDVSTHKPTGSITLGTNKVSPPKDRKFTFSEITDLINESLMAQKYILIRRQTTFIVVPADEKIDNTLIPLVEISELPNRGKTELVQVLIPLKEMNVEDTAPEVQKMLTPFGSVSALAKANALLVMDTAGNILRIAKMIEEIEATAKPAAKKDPGKAGPELRKYSVPAGTADAVAKTLLASDSTLRIIALPTTNEILVLATPAEHIAFAAKLKNIAEEKKPEEKK